MKTKLIPTWILVADASRAEIFALSETDGARGLHRTGSLADTKLERRSSDLKSDKPGRSVSSTGSGVRHAIEPHHDYHKLQKHEFAHDIIAFLEKSFDAHQFERLVLVAPNRMLGELRKLLPHKMQKSVWHSFPHDYMKLSQDEIWARISPDLKEHVQPG